MPFFCEIDHKLHFNIEIRVDSELLEQDLSQLFKNTIVTATNIKKNYDYCISKEGKILGQERIKLVESLVIHGGNLKKVAEEIKISYPTLKNRLDEVAAILKRESAELQRKRSEILDAIEEGTLSPDEGAERLEAL